MNYQEAFAVVNRENRTYIVTENGVKTKKRLFVSANNNLCEFKKRSTRYGYVLTPEIVERWKSVEPEQPKQATNLVLKFKRYAQKASFTNTWLRKVMEADETESPYENRITTGTEIDGKIISLDAIAKQYGYIVDAFRNALKNRIGYESGRFRFRGYDCSLCLRVVNADDGYYKRGDVCGYFNMEFKDRGNGYYYNLINDENFIGYDVD